MQMIRSNNNTNTANLNNKNNTVNGSTNSVNNLETMPSKNEGLQRDYSYEAEQYEQKLIQVRFCLIVDIYLNIYRVFKQTIFF